MKYGKDLENKENKTNKNKLDEEQRIKLIKDNLKCSISKENYIDKKDIILGYPIIENKKFTKNKIELIPELISYNEFINEMGEFNIFPYFNSSSKNNYNYWIPIYIDKDHYEKNKNTILNTFSLIKYGLKDIEEYSFEPEQFFEVFPIILNAIIKGILNESPQISSDFIKCYFHYILLFKKLTEEFEKEFIKYLNHQFNIIHKNEYKINKSIIPDIQDFITLLYFCDRDLHTEKLKKMWYNLFEEYLIRVIISYYRDERKQTNLRKKINNILLKKEIIIEIFEKDYKNKYFVELIKKVNIYDKVYDIIISDEEFLSFNKWTKNYAKLKLDKKIDENFKNIYVGEVNEDSQKKLFDLIFNNLDFIESFELERKYKYEYYNKINKEDNKIIINDIINYLIENPNNKLIINIFELNAYQSQIENKILLISFLLQNKFKEKGFMEELETNYGVYFDIDNIYNEIKNKLKEIKSYKKLFEYIGSEFGKNMDNFEIIKNAYSKAKYIGLIFLYLK